ncbi:MAG: SDR family oxidoreductase [Pirellulaceae bacterium]|nr:SDR family oxidoreductase [Pirellulaceae bacterium]
MVRRFVDQGARVHFCDLDAAVGKDLQGELGDHAHFRRVDLTREKQLRSWIDRVAQQEASIDVLINNAARDPRIALTEMTTKQWDAVFALNIRAFIIAVQQSVPHMPPTGGAIINFSSITHHLSPAEMSAYVSTKSGIIGLTRSLARELGPQNIRVNTLSPGWIMTERQLEQFVTPQVKRMLKKQQCIADLIQPDEIANVALFLASSASAAITGQELLADRGWAHS